MSTAITSVWSSMKPNSASSETYSLRWRGVSCGSARKTGPDLEDALEDADHDLLVELRALRQVRRARRSSRRRRRWRRPRSPTATILGVWISTKSVRAQRRAEPGRCARRGGSRARWRGMAQGERRVVEDRRQLRLERGPEQVERRRRARLPRRPRRSASWTSTPPGACGSATASPVDAQHRLVVQSAPAARSARVLDDDLREPLAVAQEQEADVAQPPQAVQPARQPHPLAGVGRAGRSSRYVP